MAEVAGSRWGIADAVARVTLVAAPLLAFNVFPVPGIVTLLMVLPLAVLTAAYLTSSGHRLPILETVLLAVLTLSIFWGDDPAYSVERLRTYLPLALATVAAAALLPSYAVLKCLETAFAVIVVSSLYFIFLSPEGGLRAGASDLTLTAQFSKNAYGGLLVLALLLVVGQRRRFNLLIVPALVLLIVFNRSVTAWVVAFFLVLGTYVSRSLIARFPPRASGPLLVSFVIVALGSTALMLLSGLDAALGAVGKDPTLGRRTEIWSASWELVKQAPLLGHGAFTFVDPASGSPSTLYVWSRFQNYRPPHPHNGFLDLMGQVGLLGVIAFAALVASKIVRGARLALTGDGPARTAVLCLVFVVAFGITEPTYLGAWLIVTLMFAAVASPTALRPASKPHHEHVPRRTPAATPKHLAPRKVTLS